MRRDSSSTAQRPCTRRTHSSNTCAAMPPPLPGSVVGDVAAPRSAPVQCAGAAWREHPRRLPAASSCCRSVLWARRASCCGKAWPRNSCRYYLCSLNLNWEQWRGGGWEGARRGVCYRRGRAHAEGGGTGLRGAAAFGMGGLAPRLLGGAANGRCARPCFANSTLIARHCAPGGPRRRSGPGGNRRAVAATAHQPYRQQAAAAGTQGSQMMALAPRALPSC